MRTTMIGTIGFALLVASACADDFTLKNATGETFGPFPIKEGASVRIDGATYSIAAITNTPEQRLIHRLGAIVIPEINFKEMQLDEAIDFLRKAAKKNDPSGEGVNFLFTPSPWGFASNMPPDRKTLANPSITLTARQIPLLEALKLVCTLAGFRAVPRRDSILVLPVDAPAGILVRRFYDVLPSFMQRTISIASDPGFPRPEGRDDDRSDLRCTFAGFGIKWPRGSSVQSLPQIGKLIVVNTEDNLANLEKVLSALNVQPGQIRLEFSFVAFTSNMVARSPSGGHFTTDDALTLWKQGKGRVAANLQVTTRSASEATSKTVTETIYPTEFSFEPSGQDSNPPPTFVGGAITPGGFETREVGFIVSVMPEVSPDGQMIDLTLTPQFVEDPVWEEYYATSAVPGVPATKTSCRQPLFSAHSISTQLSVYRGTAVVVGGGWPLRRSSEVMYLIMKTDIVGADGKVIPPPDLNLLIPDAL